MSALYDVSIPAFIRGLENLSTLLEKGKEFALTRTGLPIPTCSTRG